MDVIVPKRLEKLSPMHVAASRGDIDALITLSRLKYDINEPEPKKGSTPLHMAVFAGNYDSVCCIIDYYGTGSGAVGGKLNINAIDRSGDTALHIASRKGDFKMARILCDADAQVDGILNRSGIALT